MLTLKEETGWEPRNAGVVMRGKQEETEHNNRKRCDRRNWGGGWYLKNRSCQAMQLKLEAEKDRKNDSPLEPLEEPHIDFNSVKLTLDSRTLRG